MSGPSDNPRDPQNPDKNPSRPLPFCCPQLSSSAKGNADPLDAYLVHFAAQGKLHSVYYPRKLTTSYAGPACFAYIVGVKKIPSNPSSSSPAEGARYFIHQNQETDRVYASEIYPIGEAHEAMQRGEPATLWEYWDLVEGVYREFRCPDHREWVYVLELWKRNDKPIPLIPKTPSLALSRPSGGDGGAGGAGKGKTTNWPKLVTRAELRKNRG